MHHVKRGDTSCFGLAPGVKPCRVALHSNGFTTVQGACSGQPCGFLLDAHPFHHPLHTARLPPTQPVAPLREPARAAWVTQELFFSQALWARRMAHGGSNAEEHLQQFNQQFDDLLAFLSGAANAAAAAPEADLSVVGGGGAPAAAAADDGHAPAAPAPPRVAHIPSKRKQREAEAAAPASGSAVKAPRPAGAQPPAASRQAAPASTQHTSASGASQSTQRTAGQPLVMAGRGRGRGRGLRR